MTLANKNILLGISGGIAAYKCAELTRRLKEYGANVRIVMSKGAQAFITPLTLQALSGNPVATELLDESAEAGMGHIELAKWADYFIVAPASANILARFNAGMADELITTIALATPATMIVCPAMNQQMYANATTQVNLSSLAQRGIHIWGPATGEQACGDIGSGRMLEPHDIVTKILELQGPKPLRGKSVVITAGPTQEAIDPVRYISNHSSGKMGFALAAAAQQAGADVTLIAGPVNLATPIGVKRINVVSAAQMHQQTLNLIAEMDAFIGCAAVADYRPADIALQKIKKDNHEMVLQLTKNPDILADVASHSLRPFTVGFAAETQDVEHYARGKLERKNLDLIAANDVAKAGQGFNSNDNEITLYWADGKLELKHGSKTDLAKQMISFIAQKI
ncbi:bifunctional phosphopantothenoylcysteine decarboxylase/phosphopantothenate--cysteine ligase CoaBC [Paraferrimonas sp. SM1919]|uniref:bifunctional phosphopantothenoylcysteine decarboxylase/phosphopantothenate--cysteine ligase CoaBC n=1 Tax=Paraferrimonas sp. SM1919 TaxID=2662263 RepID=UPI0013D866F0|nr:bifunctional phosphopantothenoylcysteine decarboxylase/phosphopantothenate--cysteine ligase CoaBC [Paraferrimonas sp. SM1919]